MLRRTLATPRRSVLVRARAPHDYLRVSSTAITAVLRERIDTGLASAAVGRIVLDVARDEALEALTVELFVQYGADILALADRTRSLANEALVDLIGPGGSRLGGRGHRQPRARQRRHRRRPAPGRPRRGVRPGQPRTRSLPGSYGARSETVTGCSSPPTFTSYAAPWTQSASTTPPSGFQT